MAGDVVAAAVILDEKKPIEGLADSKKISEKKRDALYDEIVKNSVSWSVGRASVSEIDQLNILQASMLAMHRAVLGLSIQPEYVLVDGNRLPNWDFPAEAVVKGDSRVREISAASIVAKVTRDREMEALDNKFPGYGFAKHKGYPTALHLQVLADKGPCAIHRNSFGPVKQIVQQTSFLDV